MESSGVVYFDQLAGALDTQMERYEPPHEGALRTRGLCMTMAYGVRCAICEWSLKDIPRDLYGGLVTSKESCPDPKLSLFKD